MKIPPPSSNVEDWLSRVGIDHRSASASEPLEIFNRLLKCPDEVVVVGRNAESEWISRHYPIRGVLDDFYSASTWQSRRILRSEDLKAGDVVINCSSSIAPVAVSRHLDRLGVEHQPYTKIADISGAWPIPNFMSQTRKSFADRFSQWVDLLETLDDEESKVQFGSVMAFRLTGDPLYMESFSIRIDEQYMEPFILEMLSGSLFIDIGGYHGETTLAFCERVPGYGAVRIYEPGQEAAERAQANTQHLKDVYVVNRGVGESSSWLNFADDGSTAAMVDPNGNTRVRIVALDEEDLRGVDLIKMDIEGWEIPALRGARHVISRDRPFLAIAAYHKGSDPIDIFSEVREMYGRYGVRFRHYTQGWSESVLYFCPASN